MTEVSSTDAARQFADLLDALEHRGERFTIVRRGRAVAQIQPVVSGRGFEVRAMLRRHQIDDKWRSELDEVRSMLVTEDRPRVGCSSTLPS